MISIVIPNYNGRKLLERNLPKVLQACKVWGGKFEIVIVDDASTDESVAFLQKKYPQIKLIAHRTNKRFAITCNEGVKAAQGEIILLLNTDVIPRDDFLKPLLENFGDPLVFAVGCREKSIQKGKIIYSGRARGCFKRGFLKHWRAVDQNEKETLWAASGSAAYRKKIWNLLGGFDPLFRPAYVEDLDFSYRALKAGFKVLFEPRSLVFHQHETTNKEALGEREMKIAAFKNQILFVWKNITDKNLLLSHFVWLPYHLVFSTIATKGLFLAGFSKACKQLFHALKSRKRVKKLFKLPDRTLLKK